jgi:DNA-directed RNA polymerase specialized sigma24 family protein
MLGALERCLFAKAAGTVPRLGGDGIVDELGDGSAVLRPAVRELPEPCGEDPDPLVVAAERDELRRRRLVLAPRERQFLGLQASGLSYEEIATRLGVTVRTVEWRFSADGASLAEAVIGVDG